MKFIVISYRPSRQGLIGPIKEEITIEEVELVDGGLESFKHGLYVPQDGYCLVVASDSVTAVKARSTNEVVPIDSLMLNS